MQEGETQNKETEEKKKKRNYAIICASIPHDHYKILRKNHINISELVRELIAFEIMKKGWQ